MSVHNNQKLLKFLELVGRLKHEPRTGWVIRDVAGCESIAGHMYRMAIMTLLLPEGDPLDKAKCMQIAVVHDLAECIVGDLTPHCGVPPDEKHRREDEAMKELRELSHPSGPSIYDIYKEYEAQSSPEAKFVKELDRFDMIQQAFEYEKRECKPGFLQEFFTAVEGKFSHPLVTGLLDELNKQRSEFQSSKITNGTKENNST